MEIQKELIMTINELELTINMLDLNDDDIIYNVRMPLKSCDSCGGNGIKAWDEFGNSILCECLISTDNSREPMPFAVLRAMHNLKKEQIEDV